MKTYSDTKRVDELLSILNSLNPDLHRRLSNEMCMPEFRIERTHIDSVISKREERDEAIRLNKVKELRRQIEAATLELKNLETTS